MAIRYKETSEDVVVTGTTYYRPTEVRFYIPEELEVLCEAKEARVTVSNGVKGEEVFTRKLNKVMSAENKDTTFQVYDRAGNPLVTTDYKTLFYAVESFYKHLAELEDYVAPEG